MKIYLVYGAINAIAAALFNLILYLTGYQTEKLSTGQYLGYIGIAIFLVVVFLGMRETREAKPDKAITYGGALGAAVMIALFSGLFSAVYNFIHFSYINPDFPQYFADLTRQKLEAKGMPEAQIDTAIRMSSMFMSPVLMAIFGVISSVFQGTIGGLILAIFVKRAPATGEFGAIGEVTSVAAPPGSWTAKQSGQSRYYTQKANSLFQAVETLKKLDSIPQLTYYVVDTPDGSLGRDLNGYYTEAPIKTENLTVESKSDKSEIVEFRSLMGYGNMQANQASVAHLKKSGEYAKLILLMKCGNCGYESPIETQSGTLIRECYRCGVKNQGHRATINVFLGSGMVDI